MIGLALVGTVPAAAEELPAGERGTEATCDLFHAEAFAAVDELEAMLPVDPVHGSETAGRIQIVVTQLNHDLFGRGADRGIRRYSYRLAPGPHRSISVEGSGPPAGYHNPCERPSGT